MINGMCYINDFFPGANICLSFTALRKVSWSVVVARSVLDAAVVSKKSVAAGESYDTVVRNQNIQRLKAHFEAQISSLSLSKIKFMDFADLTASQIKLLACDNSAYEVPQLWSCETAAGSHIECCPNTCSNTVKCKNRRISRRQAPLVDIRRSPVAGYGAFATSDMQCGDFVGDYVGRVITRPFRESFLCHED